MRVSKKCLNLVKEFEGLYLEAYPDPGYGWRFPTIGYGTTNADKDITGVTIKKGMKISKETAEKWLLESLNKKYLPLVLKYQKNYNFNTSQIDALVSFAYNVGNIDSLTDHGRRTIPTIEKKMLLYKKSNGKVYAGLLRRREAELELFKAGPKKFDEGFPTLPKRGYFEQGDTGKQVERVQRLLSWLNCYEGVIDGIYGKKTSDAVLVLQRLIPTKLNGKFGDVCLPFCKKIKK